MTCSGPDEFQVRYDEALNAAQACGWAVGPAEDMAAAYAHGCTAGPEHLEVTVFMSLYARRLAGRRATVEQLLGCVRRITAAVEPAVHPEVDLVAAARRSLLARAGGTR